MADYIQDPTDLIAMIHRFLAFLRSRDGDRPLSFVDKNTFLGREENYKSIISELARTDLRYDSWDTSWIGSGKILARCSKAMNRSGNLVNKYQQTAFRNMLDPGHERFRPAAERALYDIYKSVTGAEEAAAFSQAKRVFGGHYDTLGYLFFVKDPSRFLPIRSSQFEESLSLIGIDHPLAGKCSWENYAGFIGIVREVQAVMQDIMPDVEVRLIDTHSFLWVIHEKVFRQWQPDTEATAGLEEATEHYIAATIAGDTVRKCRLTRYITRSAEVGKATKARAHGMCQLCGKPAPFSDRRGEPYLETHHIIWLSRGGKDSLDNTAALCPNCHTMMHIVDDEADVKTLLDRIK